MSGNGVPMGNCYKVYRNGRLWAIVHTQFDADYLRKCVDEHKFYRDTKRDEWRTELAYVPDIGF